MVHRALMHAILKPSDWNPQVPHAAEDSESSWRLCRPAVRESRRNFRSQPALRGEIVDTLGSARLRQPATWKVHSRKNKSRRTFEGRSARTRCGLRSHLGGKEPLEATPRRRPRRKGVQRAMASRTDDDNVSQSGSRSFSIADAERIEVVHL